MKETLLAELSTIQDELTSIRQDIHAHPESAMKEVRTAALVAAKLKQWGLTVTEGVGGVGVVGTLRSHISGSRSIGLRADMDALEIVEENDIPYVSTNPGVMHACGHDGHTAMLLGAAKYLAEKNNTFCGTVYFIFQPAEEKLGGALAMINDQLFDRFPMDAIYGMHNDPYIPLGKFAIRPGPMMAAADSWFITFRGSGGHGAAPHLGTDVTVLSAAFIQSVQTVTSRNIAAADSAVISIGAIQCGSFDSVNVIPSEIRIGGTARSFTPDVRDTIERRIKELATNQAISFGCTAEVHYNREGVPLVNHLQATERAIKAAEALVGTENVDKNTSLDASGEDFAEMLERKMGAYIYIGIGLKAGVGHSSTYNFNDEAIPLGVGYWVTLVQQELY